MRPYCGRLARASSEAARAIERLRSWVSGFAVLCLGLAACGGGGAPGAGGEPLPQLGAVEVLVRDRFDAPVAGARVEGPLGALGTNAQGLALVLLEAPDASASVTVSRDTFVDRSVTVTGAPGRVNQVTVVLERKTAPAGGSLASRSGALPSVTDGATRMTFEVELVVVDGASQPIDNLGASNFALRPCTPDPASERVDCVRGLATEADVAYEPAAAAPEAVVAVPGAAAQPYAAALLLDQSGSTLLSDPTGARLYAAKAFLSGLGSDDFALLAAFAGAPGAQIATPPLTVYPPFRDRTAAPQYFATLDALAAQVGGNTPLYDSIDATRDPWLGDASAPAALPRAVVAFTDGADTTCGATAGGCLARRQQTIAAANAAPARLFTIGLSAGADIAALGELANGTGGALLYAESAEQLLPLYGSVGKLLSLSMPTYRLRWTVASSSPNAFAPGSTLLGRVQVTTPAGTFDVPFVVGIP